MFFIVIYLDVLFIINFFITFLLLEITARLCKKEPRLFRLVLSAAFGGLYSMIILVDNLPWYISLISKIAACVLIILIAFKFYRVKSFAVALGIFLFSNFLFLGIIVGIYLLSGNQMIAVNNSTVYLNIGAKALLFSAAAAYVIASLVVRIYNKSVSKGDIYSLVIENGGRSVSLFALADTGNKLREPFSDSPVIVVEKEKASCLFENEKARIVPVTSVNKNSYLQAYKPDKITIKTAKGEEVIEKAYIALSDKMKSSGFSAVINPEILSL